MLLLLLSLALLVLLLLFVIDRLVVINRLVETIDLSIVVLFLLTTNYFSACYCFPLQTPPCHFPLATSSTAFLPCNGFGFLAISTVAGTLRSSEVATSTSSLSARLLQELANDKLVLFRFGVIRIEKRDHLVISQERIWSCGEQLRKIHWKGFDGF